jgi:hypothetical protein
MSTSPINRQTLKRQTLLGRWTLRYVLTLFTGLLVIGLGSILWTEQGVIHERKQALREFSQEAAQYVTDRSGQIVVPDGFYEWIDRTQRRYRLPGQFALAVYDHGGTSAFYQEISTRPFRRSPSRYECQT